MSLVEEPSNPNQNRPSELLPPSNSAIPPNEAIDLFPNLLDKKVATNGDIIEQISVPQLKNPTVVPDKLDIFKNRNKNANEKKEKTMITRNSTLNTSIFDRIKKNGSNATKMILDAKTNSFIKEGKETKYDWLKSEEDKELKNQANNKRADFAEFLGLKQFNGKPPNLDPNLLEKPSDRKNLQIAHTDEKKSNLELDLLEKPQDQTIQQKTHSKSNFKKQLIRTRKDNSIEAKFPKLLIEPEINNVVIPIELNDVGDKTKIENKEPVDYKKKIMTGTKEEKNIKKPKKTISKPVEGGPTTQIKKKLMSKDDDIQCEIILEQERIKTSKNSTTNITELFPPEFFAPDLNFMNANPFIDISNLASRKNTNELFRHLLNYRLEWDPVTVEKVPNNFNSPFEYLSIFKTLFLNEVTARIGNLFKDLLRPNKQNYSLAPYRIKMLNDQTNNEFTYFEISDIKSDAKKIPKKGENEPETSLPNNSFTRKMEILDSCFDIKYAKNFLVLLTNFTEIKLELLKDDDFSNKNYFLILGIIMNEKTENLEMQKVVTNVRKENFSKFYKTKTDWLEINLYPLEKITTFLREYFSIQNLQYEEISKRIYKPRMTLVSNSVDNLAVLSKFFESIQKQYNDSQYQAIKEICSIKEGISLLQGPPGTGKTFTLIGIVSGLYHYIKHSTSTYKRYIMICAPSNAAIDEIITRIKKKGLIDENGNSAKPQLIRIGVLDNNPSDIVKNVSLEHLAQEVLFNQEKLSMKKDQSTAVEIRQILERLNAKIEKIKKECDDPNNQQTKKILDALFDRKRRLNFDYHQVKQNKLNYKEKYKQIVDNLLNKAEIICCTLSSSGADKMDFFKNKIEALIVDEASQCTEPTNIIPFQLSINKVILIGDPKQLPATTFSPDSNKTLYNRSLFERFIDNGITPFFLDEQYRMHESIREFPSLMFYENRLKDGEIIKTRKFPKYLLNFETKNLFFIDLGFSKEKTVDYSYSNEEEAWLALKICKFLIKKNSNLSDQSFFTRIGLITPYKRQVGFFRDIYKKDINNKYHQIQVNTVDSFQGQEKDIIIFSTVRSSKDSRERENIIGFLDDMRRMNVALTRAKFVLIIIGNGDTLSSNEIWSKLLNHLISKGSYYKLTKPEEMDTFAEIMFRNPTEIPSIFKRTSMIYPLRTLKKSKISDNTAKTTLFEENFARQSFKHNRVKKQDHNGLNTILVEDNKQDEEKSEEWKLGEMEDILAHEDHSYLFKNNEQKSNLMCLISKKNEINEEKIEKSVFNIFEIANNIMK